LALIVKKKELENQKPTPEATVLDDKNNNVQNNTTSDVANLDKKDVVSELK